MAKGWPSYACELCVGQEPQQGCYCAYYGASAPGCPPTRFQQFWRWLYDRIYPDLDCFHES